MVQPFAAAASNEPVIDTSRIDEGVISVSHTAGQRLKVIVARGDKEVIYDLRNDGIAETYPLQLGNGEYTVSVLENTTGNKYRYIKKQTVRLELEDEKQVFLASVQNINWRYDMKAVQKAKELTAGLKSDSEKIKKIYDYIVNNFRYDYELQASRPTGYLPCRFVKHVLHLAEKNSAAPAWVKSSQEDASGSYCISNYVCKVAS